MFQTPYGDNTFKRVMPFTTLPESTSFRLLTETILLNAKKKAFDIPTDSRWFQTPYGDNTFKP